MSFTWISLGYSDEAASSSFHKKMPNDKPGISHGNSRHSNIYLIMIKVSEIRVLKASNGLLKPLVIFSSGEYGLLISFSDVCS